LGTDSWGVFHRPRFGLPIIPDVERSRFKRLNHEAVDDARCTNGLKIV
jgi:hypothetical protein